MIIRGDSTEELKKLDADSVDAVVTDPPYGWRFMGKAWDGEDIDRMTEERAKYQQSVGKDGKPRTSPRVAPSESAGKYDNSMLANRNFMNWTCLWATEAYRVLKPGGYMLVFCGPRTYHRMASGVEDAGFEIRDQLQWLFGSGFPKSLDVSKAIDKAAGAEREVIGYRDPKGSVHGDAMPDSTGSHIYSGDLRSNVGITDEAKQWQGWGTALKPANEPIVLARKPLSESTVAKNVLKHGMGALNIDVSRIATSEKLSQGASDLGYGRVTEPVKTQQHPQGRWPANVLFDEKAAAMLDEQSGVLKSGGKQGAEYLTANAENQYGFGKNNGDKQSSSFFGTSGGASRFFYVAKASKRERNAGMDDKANNHCTVKPIRLMEYLCKLITPPGGIILDPFMGSGTTGVAAKRLGFEFIGIEREQEYVDIATRRIEHATP